MSRRYEATGRPDDLATARAAMSAGQTPAAGNERQRVAVLVALHAQGSDPAQLEAVVEAATRAVRDAGPVHRPPALVNLGTALSARYTVTGDVADLDKVIDAYRDAVALTPEASPYTRRWWPRGRSTTT